MLDNQEISAVYIEDEAMKGLIEVVDLSTGDSMYFDPVIGSSKAVSLAYAMSVKRFRGVDTNFSMFHVTEGKYTVACGDFCALKTIN
jgi:hypothetical protein